MFVCLFVYEKCNSSEFYAIERWKHWPDNIAILAGVWIADFVESNKIINTDMKSKYTQPMGF